MKKPELMRLPFGLAILLVLVVGCKRQPAFNEADSGTFVVDSQGLAFPPICCADSLVVDEYWEAKSRLPNIARRYVSSPIEDTCLLYTLFLINMHSELYSPFLYVLDSMERNLSESQNQVGLKRLYKLSLAVSGAGALEISRRQSMVDRFSSIFDGAFFREEIHSNQMLNFCHQYSPTQTFDIPNPFEYQVAKKAISKMLRQHFDCDSLEMQAIQH